MPDSGADPPLQDPAQSLRLTLCSQSHDLLSLYPDSGKTVAGLD